MAVFSFLYSANFSSLAQPSFHKIGFLKWVLIEDLKWKHSTLNLEKGRRKVFIATKDLIKCLLIKGSNQIKTVCGSYNGENDGKFTRLRKKTF